MNGKSSMSEKSTILIIDDEIKALHLLQLSLEAYGFVVDIASNGVDGLKLAFTNKPDLIILDIRMPMPDGWEVCNLLKGNSLTKNIPVIFLTAYSSNHNQERAKCLGVTTYLTKPVNPEILMKIIRSELNQSN